MTKTISPPSLQYRNRFLEIHHVHADFESFSKDYYIVELGPRAGIVVIQDDRVLLAKQYRFLINDFSWELPGGRVEEDESPEVAAVRECLEETGYQCNALRQIVEYFPGLDNFNNRTTVFVSKSAQQVHAFHGDDAEVIATKWFPMDEALQMVFSGVILDALTIVGLLAYASSPTFSSRSSTTP